MGHVIRTEEQQAAVDGLKRFLEAEIEPIFNKQYRDKFVPKEQMRQAFLAKLVQPVSQVLTQKASRGPVPQACPLSTAARCLPLPAPKSAADSGR